jgi:hypothetical protein
MPGCHQRAMTGQLGATACSQVALSNEASSGSRQTSACNHAPARAPKPKGEVGGQPSPRSQHLPLGDCYFHRPPTPPAARSWTTTMSSWKLTGLLAAMNEAAAAALVAVAPAKLTQQKRTLWSASSLADPQTLSLARALPSFPSLDPLNQLAPQLLPELPPRTQPPHLPAVIGGLQLPLCRNCHFQASFDARASH